MRWLMVGGFLTLTATLALLGPVGQIIAGAVIIVFALLMARPPVHRVPIIAALVVAAVILTPYALEPGFNSADALWIAAPLGILTVGAWPRRTKTTRSNGNGAP